MKPKIAANTACHTGEGPLWHPENRVLYWVDIPKGELYQLDPSTGEHTLVYEDEPIGGFTLQEDGDLLLFMNRCAVKCWDGEKATTVLEGIPGEEDTRFNDVIADPAGRVFCGTMSCEDHPGRLYRLDPDGSLTVVLEGVGTSNGMGFTPDGKRMYHTDSHTRKIILYDYDRETGDLSQGRLFLEVPEGEGVPDGMTVDAEGKVWSARWDGSCSIRYDEQGKELQRIEFPAKKVSCVTFGGKDYKEMYFTTAGGQDKKKEGEGAGALFSLRSEVQGVPEFRSRVDIP